MATVGTAGAVRRSELPLAVLMAEAASLAENPLFRPLDPLGVVPL
ncbi:hypothetical protein AB0M86_17945 [Streptomyces sp. NPDC051639]